VLTQPGEDLILLFGEPSFGNRITDEVTAARVALDSILTAVEVGYEADDDLALLLAALYEIFALVIELIEESPGDGFDNRRLARAVRPADGDYTGKKVPLRVGVILYVLEFDSGDQQSGRMDFRF